MASKLARRFDSPTAPIRVPLAGDDPQSRADALSDLLDALASDTIARQTARLVVTVEIDASTTYEVHFDVLQDPALLNHPTPKRNAALFTSDTVTSATGDLASLEESTMNTARTRARKLLDDAIKAVSG